VTSATLLQQGIFMANAVRILTHRVVFGAISFYYYNAIMDKACKIRPPPKSPTSYETNADDASQHPVHDSSSHSKTE